MRKWGLNIIWLLLLTGCIVGGQSGVRNTGDNRIGKSVQEKGRIFHNEEIGYEVTIPEKLSRWTTWSEGLEGTSYPHFTTTLGEINEVSATIFHLSPSSHCHSIGVSDPISNTHDGVPVWSGKVDFPSDYELTPLQPDCRAYKPYASSYILCSEKNGVQVAICISQVTDDPALADAIFDTFRWVK